MKEKQIDKEELIKETAKRVLFREGNFNATTKDIADAAGVSRPSLHYYFRSKDVLFRKIFKETMADVKHEIDSMLVAEIPFQSKIEKLVSLLLSRIGEMPYREIFLINEINSADFELDGHGSKEQLNVKEFLNEVQSEMDKGTIVSMNPAHFMLNIFALVAHPFLTGPLNKRIFVMNDTQYLKLLNERKDSILKMLLQPGSNKI